MTAAMTLQDYAAEVASAADRLQGNLTGLSRMLGHYTSRVAERDALEVASMRSMRQLEALSKRLDAVEDSDDQSAHRISDQEHAALDAARDLRTRMMTMLSELQQAEWAPNKPNS
ncbi:MAG: hypothetical protein EON93_02670 [Burkholderiales bacterium]|jgi:hypothetical protein|nr:MAG: hypothetical protein EON93_02670 [Burkholderiales bacterium]